MSSAIKPLTASPQNSTSSSQLNKTMHSQGSTTSYNQPTHVPHGLGNMHTNTNVAHNHQNQQHHYSLNVPNTSGHYINQNVGQIPASNHPVANPSATAAGQGYSTQKNVTNYMSNYQSNLAHQQNQSTFPPISQTLPPTLPQQNITASHNSDSQSEKPHSNGTQEVKSTQKSENQSNFSLTSKDKVPQPAPVPQLLPVQDKAPEKSPQPSQVKPSDVTESKSIVPSPSLKPALVTQPSETSVPAPTTTSSNNPTATGSENDKLSIAGQIESPQSRTSHEEADKTDVHEKKISEKEENLENATESNKETKAEETIIPNPSEPAPSTENKLSSKPQEQSPQKESYPPKQSSSTSTTSPLAITATPKISARNTKTQLSKPEESSKIQKEPKALIQKSPSTSKVKRQRIRTQPYQSPLPEVELASKISSSTPRSNDEKLIVFYKNEFLAVRNVEGGFFLCQAVQNIYKSSSKIKIRWLSLEKTDKTGEIYTPDFYDQIDFDCILTNLSLSRVDKGKFKLPPSEKERTQSILNRSLAVEKGEVTSPSLTEEHPDGLDLSLYKDEDQLKKRTSRKRKLSRKPLKPPVKEVPTKKSPESPKVRKVVRPIKTVAKKVAVVKKAVVTKKVIAQPEPKKSASPSTSRSTSRSKRKVATKANPVVDQKKAKVLAKIGKKSVSVSKSTPSNTKNVKSGAKPAVPLKKAASTKASSSAPVKPPPRNSKRSTRK